MDDILSQGEIDALMSDLSDGDVDKNVDSKETNISPNKNVINQAHRFLEVLHKLEEADFVNVGALVKFESINLDDELTAAAFAKEMNAAMYTVMLAWKRAYRERVIGTLRESYTTENIPKKKLDKVGNE